MFYIVKLFAKMSRNRGLKRIYSKFKNCFGRISIRKIIKGRTGSKLSKINRSSNLKSNQSKKT